MTTDGGREADRRKGVTPCTDAPQRAPDAIVDGVMGDPVSQTTEPICRRCARPTGRLAHALYCADCAGVAYRDAKRRNR